MDACRTGAALTVLTDGANVQSCRMHKVFTIGIAIATFVSGCTSQPDLHIPNAAPLLFQAKAEGVIIYDCQGVDPDTWTYRGTDASLFDERSQQIGTHDFSLGRPAKGLWTLQDGSSASGEIIQKVLDPRDKEIPSLLFAIRNHAGVGAMSEVQSVRQLEPKGGIPPTVRCSPMNAILRVPFTATLQFYGAGKPE